MSIYKRKCQECGKEFDGGPRAWYCPDCREIRRIERERKYHIYGNNRKLGDIDYCQNCGKEYIICSGLQKYCPACKKEMNRKKDNELSTKYYYDVIDKTVRNQKRRENWKNRTPERRNQIREKRRRKRQENPEKYRAYSRKWYAENTEKVKEYRKKRKNKKNQIIKMERKNNMNYIKYERYLAYVGEAKNLQTAREFLSEYGFPTDCPYTADGVIKMCEIIFAVSRQDVEKIIELSGMTRSKFAKTYHIPYSTVNNWVDGGGNKRTPPEYVIEMIGYTMLSALPKEGNE